MWPILYTNFLLRCLVDSIAVCARDSTRLTSITFNGIPLHPKYLNILCAGLRNNQRLTYLSLKKCKIGDVGCTMLLESLMNNPNIRVLNLSGCRLTSKSATSLYLFLKRRRADLLQNVWTETSDRSHECCSPDKVQGLHTLMLNQNPQFGDSGVRLLMQAVQFDCWLKSLGLKHCGLTTADDINNVLKSNTALARIDLAHNRISINTLKAIRKLLKRREDTTESKAVKKRLLANWKKSSLRSGSKNENQRLNKRIDRYHRNSLKSCPLKMFSKIQEAPKQLKVMKNTKKESALEMKKENLRGLECQLLDIIDSNRKLMKELMNNKALVDEELQERSRTETEMQRLSLQLYDLRSRVIMVNYMQAQLNDENQILQKSFRYFFEKLTSLSIQEWSDN
ncbi:uncharacterized protein LOC143207110 [Lasioglossum baleicum]|uniref:uncharacterized protein LOC143207110 n=1 Tax=Lasioglossum baleicum TaxID=434251 RepID=UPI003FCE33F9